MKVQDISHKYTIAWFRLAEFVVMGKKQQALSIFRLLSYSLADQALVLQLEGDLLLSFADEKAVDVYRRAALLYEKQEKYMQAAAIYEHLLSLRPYTLEYAISFVALTRYLNNAIKYTRARILFADACIYNGKIEELITFCQTESCYADKMLLYERIIFSTLESAQPIESHIYTYLKEVSTFLCNEDTQRLQAFLTRLRIFNDVIYTAVIDHLSKV